MILSFTPVLFPVLGQPHDSEPQVSQSKQWGEGRPSFPSHAGAPLSLLLLSGLRFYCDDSYEVSKQVRLLPTKGAKLSLTS